MSDMSFEAFKEKADSIMSPIVDNYKLLDTYLVQMNTGRDGSISAYSKMVSLLGVIITNVPAAPEIRDELRLLAEDFTDSQIILLEATRNLLRVTQQSVESLSKIYDLVEDCFVEGDEDASMEKDG